MKRPSLAAVAGAVYLAVALLTYGRAAQECRGCDNSLQAGLVAFVSATLWPLWWSWELQDHR